MSVVIVIEICVKHPGGPTRIRIRGTDLHCAVTVPCTMRGEPGSSGVLVLCAVDAGYSY